MPYRGQRRQYNPYGGSGGRLSDLMLAQGEQQANLAREQGDIWGQFLQNVGQTAGDTLQAYQKDERERPAREQAQRIADRQEDELTRSLAERDRAQAQAGRMESYADEYFDWGYTGNTFGIRNPDKAMQKVPREDRAAFAAQYKTLFESIGVARKAAEETMGVWAESVVEDVDEMMANPRLFMVALAPMVKNNMIPDDIAAEMYMEAMDNPRSIPKHIQGFLLAAGKLTPQEMETRVVKKDEVLLGITGDDVQEIYTPPTTQEPVTWQIRTIGQAGKNQQIVAINPQNPEEVRTVFTNATISTSPPQSSYENAAALRKAFDTEQRSFSEMTRALDIMRNSIAKVEEAERVSGTLDEGHELMAGAAQGVLVTFQKILDPTSVVRESEYERSASDLSFMGGLQAWYQQLVDGGTVPLNVLKNFQSIADSWYEGQKGYVENSIPFWRREASRLGETSLNDVLSGIQAWEAMGMTDNTGNERIRLGGQQ
jgi:hypothetical protein